MTEAQKGDPAIKNPEDAFLNENVIPSLLNSDWYTTEYIEDVKATEPEPERPGLGEFVDKRLGRFFLKQIDLGSGNEAYLATRMHLMQKMGDTQGHTFKLGRISFYDEEIAAYARDLGVDESWEFDRIMIFEGADRSLMCMIAPEDIRRRVVRVLHNHNSIDVALWSQMVRKGAKKFIEERWSDK